MTDKIAAVVVAFEDSVIVISERGRVFRLRVPLGGDHFVYELTSIPLDAAPAGECQVFEDRDAP